MEEIPQGYLTAALDRYIMAESSHWETRKIELTAQGLSPEEAEKQLWSELNYDAILNGVTGFLTSGTLSVAGYGAGKLSTRKSVAALAPDDPKIKGSGILAKYQRDIISLDNLKAAYAEAEAAGSTPEQLARIDEKIQKQEAALEAQEASTELTRVLEADGLGAVRNGEGEMAEESDVSPEIARQMAENQEQDQAEFAHYQETLGTENMPKDLAEFQLMKYTEPEKWEDFKGWYDYKGKVPDASRTEYKQYKIIKSENLIKGVVVPIKHHHATILSASAGKDPNHIMKRMLERHITDDDVQSYVDTATICLQQFGGNRLVYISPKGVTVLMREKSYSNVEWIAKTTYNSADYDANIQRILKIAMEE